MSTTTKAQGDLREDFAPSARPWRADPVAWVGARPVHPGVLVLYGEEHANLALADELALDGYEVRRAGDPAMLRARCGPGEVELVLFGRSSHRGAGLDVLRKLRAGEFAPQVKPGLRTLWMSPHSSTLVACYSSCGGWRRGRSSRLIVCWQVVQRPVQHLNRGWNRRTAWGRVRPAAGDLGAAAPG